MTTENLLVNDGGNGQAVEAVCERLPQLDVEPSLALVVEAVDPVYARALVIASQQEEILWIFDFIRQQQTDRLQRLLASVHVVAKEQIVGFRWESTVLE